MSDASPTRHLTPTGLLQHWAAGVPVVIPVEGVPPLRLTIDPPHGRVSLRAPVPAGSALPANPLSHLSLTSVVQDGQRFVEISTIDERLAVDGYAMLAVVADRIQLEGQAPLAALEETLESWRAILATRVRMSPEAEIGLMGELLVLEALLRTKSVPSVRCWKAIHREEHDFGLIDTDLEVKTASGERRQHWIHGLGQLTPTGATPLWLLSLQLTRGGAGTGRTLPAVIDAVASAARPEERELFRQALADIGWRPGDSDLFATKWRLRSVPAPFVVDDTFPRLTDERLATAGINTAAITRVAYEVDLTMRVSSSDPPGTIADLLSHISDDPSAS